MPVLTDYDYDRFEKEKKLTNGCYKPFSFLIATVCCLAFGDVRTVALNTWQNAPSPSSSCSLILNIIISASS